MFDKNINGESYNYPLGDESTRTAGVMKVNFIGHSVQLLNLNMQGFFFSVIKLRVESFRWRWLYPFERNGFERGHDHRPGHWAWSLEVGAKSNTGLCVLSNRRFEISFRKLSIIISSYLILPLIWSMYFILLPPFLVRAFNSPFAWGFLKFDTKSWESVIPLFLQNFWIAYETSRGFWYSYLLKIWRKFLIESESSQ